jgi:hypothetical protein
MADYGINASISDGAISSLRVTRSSLTGSEKLATFSVDSGVATVSRVHTDKPTRLLESISEVYNTEYVEEVVLFDKDGDQMVMQEEIVNELED